MSNFILNFGSINIDHVYRVPHLVQPGETLASLELSSGLGGKGANQSVALAHAGADVKHIGKVSVSDQWAIELMAASGVDVELISTVNEASGHAIIQVNEQGENAIVLHGGANQTFQHTELEQLFARNAEAEFLLMQNECNMLASAFELAHQHGIKLVLNPAPMTDDIKALPLHLLNTLIINQLEAEALTEELKIDDIADKLASMLPNTRCIITRGAQGAVLLSKENRLEVPAPPVNVVDTTGAGDTFVGFFLAGLLKNLSEIESLNLATQAAALAVTGPGAISSIPSLDDLT